MRRSTAVAATVGFVVLTAAGCGDGTSVAGDSPSPVASDSPSPTQPPEQAAAEAFVTLSSDGPDQVPWADQVTYSIGGVQVGTFAPGATVPNDVKRCPLGKNEVEGHTCPVSPLDTVADVAPMASIEMATPDRVGCNLFVAPKVPARLTSASIRPPADSRNCFSDFAVTLYVDDAGHVQWLDFALSGP